MLLLLAVSLIERACSFGIIKHYLAGVNPGAVSVLRLAGALVSVPAPAFSGSRAWASQESSACP